MKLQLSRTIKEKLVLISREINMLCLDNIIYVFNYVNGLLLKPSAQNNLVFDGTLYINGSWKLCACKLPG